MKPSLLYITLFFGMAFSNSFVANAESYNDKIISIPGILKEASHWTIIEQNIPTDFQVKTKDSFIPSKPKATVEGEILPISSQLWSFKEECLTYGTNKHPCFENDDFEDRELYTPYPLRHFSEPTNDITWSGEAEWELISKWIDFELILNKEHYLDKLLKTLKAPRPQNCVSTGCDIYILFKNEEEKIFTVEECRVLIVKGIVGPPSDCEGIIYGNGNALYGLATTKIVKQQPIGGYAPTGPINYDHHIYVEENSDINMIEMRERILGLLKEAVPNQMSSSKLAFTPEYEHQTHRFFGVQDSRRSIILNNIFEWFELKIDIETPAPDQRNNFLHTKEHSVVTAGQTQTVYTSVVYTPILALETNLYVQINPQNSEEAKYWTSLNPTQKNQYKKALDSGIESALESVCTQIKSQISVDAVCQ